MAILGLGLGHGLGLGTGPAAACRLDSTVKTVAAKAASSRRRTRRVAFGSEPLATAPRTMRHMRRLGAYLALPWLLACVSCRGPQTQSGDSFRVTLLMSTPTSEQWRSSASRGLQRIGSELDVVVSEVLVSSESEQRTLLQEHAGAGVNLIFCVGEGYAPLVFPLAPAHPATRFILLPGRGNGESSAGIEFRVEGAAYLGGVLAGLLSENGEVGVVFGSVGSWIDGAEEAFLAGFRSRHRGGERVGAHGPDGPWALAAQGVAVALYVADRAEPEVLSAAHTAGVRLVVTAPAALETDADVALAAIVVDVSEAMVRVAQEAVDGSFRGPVYAFDLGSGVVNLRLGPLLTEIPDPRVHEALEQARAEVTAGIVELESFGM